MYELKEIKGNRILVTGGAGFVGSRLVKRLIELGAEVTVLDDLTTGRIELIDEKATFVNGSVEDRKLVDSLAKNVDIIFHLAARVLLSSTKDIRADADVNIGGMLNVLEASKNRNVKRVVYSSTTSVYGNSSHIPTLEETIYDIVSPYAASKLSAESYCKVYHEMYDLPVSIVRYSNVYGPHQSPKNPYCGVVSKFIDAAYRNNTIKIHGNGQQTRDFTYIDDAVEATVIASISPRAIGEVMNVGTGMETSVLELAEIVKNVTKSKCDIEYVDKRDIDNIFRRAVNPGKARRYLRWVPHCTLPKGIKITNDWVVNNL